MGMGRYVWDLMGKQGWWNVGDFGRFWRFVRYLS